MLKRLVENNKTADHDITNDLYFIIKRVNYIIHTM